MSTLNMDLRGIDIVGEDSNGNRFNFQVKGYYPAKISSEIDYIVKVTETNIYIKKHGN